MKTDLKQYTVAEVTDGFVYSEFEAKGLFGLNAQLVIQRSTSGTTSTATASAT